MLFRKFKLLSFLGILVLVAAVTSGLSYWAFTDSSSADSTNQSVSGGGENHPAQSDGIFENYSFSNGELGEKYEFYFFPSTLYLELYSNGYEQPEDVFGYNEVQFDDNGNAIINDNGLAKYEVIGDDDDEKEEHRKGLYLNNQIYREYRRADYDYDRREWYRPNDWEDGGLVKDVGINYHYDMSEYGKSAPDESSGITYYYKPDLDEPASGTWPIGNIQNRYWLQTGEHVSTYYKFLTNNDVINNDSYYLNKDAQISKTIGYQFFEDKDRENNFKSKNPSYDYAFSPVYGQDPDSKLGINMDLETAFGINNSENNGRFGKRRQYRNDRLGFWHGLYDLDDPNNSDVPKNQGFGSRYLPIKLTVTGSLNPNQLKHVLPPVMTSASDANSYFNFYSNVWVYTDPETGDKPYKTSKDGFTNKAQSSIFDIMKNPSLYAMQEEREDGTIVNVIRLYPLFSSGSNDIGDEGLDFVRVAYDYYDNYSGLDKIIAETPMTYSKEQIILSNDNNKKLRYLILNNVYLESGKYESIQFNIGIRGLDGSYQSHKLASQQKTNDSGTIYEGAIDEIISNYGEGYYTFYMVLKYPESGNGSIPGELVGGELAGNIKNIITNSDGNGASGTFFNTLNRKNLIYSSTTSDGSDFSSEYRGTYSIDTNLTFCDINYQQKGHDSYRPALLMFEKVTSLKMITNVPIPDNNNFTWSEIDDTINSVYDTSKTLINASGVYEATREDFDNDGENFSSTNKTDLTLNNPYIYVIQNVDFRYVNSLYFQIRLGDHYVYDAMTIRTKVPEDQDDYIAFKYGKDQNGKDLYTIFASQSSLFSSEDNYFIQNATVSDKDGVPRQGLKLKDTYAKGVYDIMLVSSSVKDNKYVFNMYINRHKLGFVKIFDKYPGTTNVINGVTYDDAYFVNHYNSNTQANLIWQNNFYIGEVLTSSSTGDGSEKLTILNAINTSTVTNATDLFALKDAVTQKAIAYYKNGVLYGGTNENTSGGKPIDLFTLLKNYVLYIEKVPSTESGTTTEGDGEGV